MTPFPKWRWPTVSSAGLPLRFVHFGSMVFTMSSPPLRASGTSAANTFCPNICVDFPQCHPHDKHDKHDIWGGPRAIGHGPRGACEGRSADLIRNGCLYRSLERILNKVRGEQRVTREQGRRGRIINTQSSIGNYQCSGRTSKERNGAIPYFMRTYAQIKLGTFVPTATPPHITKSPNHQIAKSPITTSPFFLPPVASCTIRPSRLTRVFTP